MKYYIKLPNVLIDENYFQSFEDADAAARMITKKTSIRFVSIFAEKKLITTIIKIGYQCCNFNKFNALDKAKKISDYFILQQDGSTNYFIKIKN